MTNRLKQLTVSSLVSRAKVNAISFWYQTDWQRVTLTVVIALVAIAMFFPLVALIEFRANR